MLCRCSLPEASTEKAHLFHEGCGGRKATGEFSLMLPLGSGSCWLYRSQSMSLGRRKALSSSEEPLGQSPGGTFKV